MPSTQMRISLLSVTPNAEALVYANAKQCTSADDAASIYEQATLSEEWGGIPDEQQRALIRRVMASGHLGIVEPVVFSFGVAGVSRALSHQLVRQRMASFCLSGESVVVAFKGRTRVHCKKWTMKRLYEMAQNSRTKVQFDRIRLRSVNSNGVIVPNNIKSITYSGEQDVYRITTKSGRSIKATSNHRFLTKNGYVELGNLSVGESVVCNGLPAYKNPEWINQHYIVENKERKVVASLAGVTEGCLGRWIKKFGLQKPHSDRPNRKPGHGVKGMFSPEAREVLSVQKKGERNPRWKGDEAHPNAGRLRCIKMYAADRCEACGTTERKIERHHLNGNPLDNSPDNIMTLCQKCHKSFHKGQAVLAVFSDEIISIDHVGVEDTYDIEMGDPWHNFVAEGFVVHNCQQSQRYVKSKNLDYVTPPSVLKGGPHEDYPGETANTFNDIMRRIEDAYDDLLSLGIPPEDARFVLPNATETKLTVTMNARSLLHFFEQRCCTRCFDEKTEVLTNEGWKFFSQLSGGELFYSINLDTHESELVSAKRFFNYHHNGNMVRLLSQSIDQLVTGNHKFVVSHDIGKKNKAYSLVEAKSVKNMKTVLMKKNCLPIIGNVPSTITLPGCVTSYKEYPSRDVDAGDFLQFLGFYLSDGCAYKSSNHLNITLCKGDLDKIGEYAELLQSITPNKVSLNMAEEAYKATVHDRVLFNFLSQFGKAKDKYIPEFVFDLDHSLISRLLQGLMDGDFSRQAKQYWTVSKRLADGIQRLLLHVGVSGTITTLQPRLDTHSGVSSSGREFNITSQPSVTYIVSFNCSKNEPIIKRGDRDPFSVEEYDGNVYCVELEKNNTLYVRRNGKPSWSGNSQWEIRALANGMLRLCKESVPVLFSTAGARCERVGFCEEEKGCGRAPRLKDVMEAYNAKA